MATSPKIQRQPLGFYTQGKGPGRIVHPVCGPCSRYVEHARRLEAKRKRAGAAKPKHLFVKNTPEHRRSTDHRQAIRGEAGLNAKATGKIVRRYPGRLREVLDAAQSAYHFHHPTSATSAEPYELLEGGYVNEGLESLGLRPLA